MGISWVNGNFVSIASASGINSLGEVGESESGCLEVSESIEAPSREDNPNDMSGTVKILVQYSTLAPRYILLATLLCNLHCACRGWIVRIRE